MKIAYAVHHLPPRYTGGAEHRALRTARWFHAHGHAAALICVEAIDEAQPAYVDSLDNGLKIRRLAFDHRTFADGGRWKYDNAFVEQQVGAFLAEQRPDVFHLFGGYLMTAGAIRAAHAAGVPIVISLTDFWFLCPRITLLKSDGALCPAPPVDPLGCVRCQAEEQRRFRLPAQLAPRAAAVAWRWLGPALPPTRAQAHHIRERRQALADALASADALICPSRFLRDRFIDGGVAPRKLRLMRQGLILPPRLPPHDASRSRPVIGYRGQIKSHKGVDLLIDAALALAADGYAFTLAIYGNDLEDRRYADRLKQRARGAACIEWRGVHNAGQVWDVLAGLDIVVAPSRWYENSPNTILEAQAAGVPVVAADLGGMAELVRPEVDGLLFKANDASDLRRQLARLLDEPQRVDLLRANAPIVKSLDHEMGELLDVYRRTQAAPDAERIVARAAA
jgi:glycosyltransferase involved in cell wall biosynthesis